MKKSLFTLAIIAALAACSQEKPAETSATTATTTAATTNTAASTATAAPATSSAPVFKEGVGKATEKADIVKLGEALKTSGMAGAATKEAEWNQRLANAKSAADVKAVLNEQLAMYQSAENALKPLQLETEKGKAVHTQLVSGLTGMREILQEMTAMDLESPAAQTKMQEITPKMQKQATDIMHAMQNFVGLMKANGLQEGSAAEAQFNQKMGELKEKIDQK